MTAMTASAPHLQILLAPWRQRLNQGSLWVWAVIAGLVYLLPFIFYLSGSSSTWLVQTTVLLLLLVLLAVWVCTVDSLHMQNSPTTARLVPGHVGRVRQSLLAAWMAIGLLAATIISFAFGHGWFFCVVALALMMAIELVMRCGRWVAVVVMASPFAPPFVAETTLGKWLTDAVVHHYRAQPLIPLFAVALILGVGMVLFAVGRGDARHCRAYERAKSFRVQIQAPQSGKSPKLFQGRIAWRLTWFMWAPYRWWMQRLLNQPQTSTRQVMAKMLLGFGPDLHWITQTSFVAFIVLVASVIGVTLSVTTSPGTARDGVAAGLGGLLFGTFSAPVLILFPQWKMLHQSQREQAMLMLLPGMPRGSALNRAVAAQWLWRFWLTWIGAVAAMWVASQTVGARPLAIGFLIPSITACLILVRDWSTVRFTGNTQMTWTFFGYFVAGAGCVWLLDNFELSPWPIMALVLLPTLLALRWRWNRLAGYRQALPAGRWG